MKTISERLCDSTARQLLELMREGVSRNPTWSDADLSAFLRYQLACPLSAVMKSSGEAGASASLSQTLRQLLASSSPDVRQLRALRRSAKAARTRGGSMLPGPLATVLYYTAIAAALVRCDCKITSLADPRMREGIEWSASRPWIDGLVRTILEEALERMKSDKGRTP